MKRPKRAARKAARQRGKTAAKKPARKTAKRRAAGKSGRTAPAKPKAGAQAKRARKPAAQKKAQRRTVPKAATRSARPALEAVPAAAPSAASVAARVAPLNLDSWAREAATLIATEFAEISFTSGRRDAADQARAMAQNVVVPPANLKWIEETYRDTPERAMLQQWVDQHPQATTVTELAAGLLGVMKAWPAARLANFSRHLSGLAFDIQPFSGGNAAKVKARMKTLPHLHQVLFKEGGAVRWHVACRSREEDPA